MKGSSFSCFLQKVNKSMQVLPMLPFDSGKKVVKEYTPLARSLSFGLATMFLISTLHVAKKGNFVSVETEASEKGAKMVARGLFPHKNRPNDVVSQSLLNPKMENFGDDELENWSGSENFEAGSGDDQNEPKNRSSKRKKHHRHSVEQTQELEAAFKENPHPGEKARLNLGRQLGLESRQVKFWFQNRRTQLKTQFGRHENTTLKEQNKKLRLENATMREVINNPICNSCGSQAILGRVSIECQELWAENTQLKEKLRQLRVNGTMCNEVNKSSLDLSMERNNSRSRNTALLVSHGPKMRLMGVHAPSNDESFLARVASNAMGELIKLVHLNSPLWVKSPGAVAASLNSDEYVKLFQSCASVKPDSFVSEGSKATDKVKIRGVDFVETLIDADRWRQMFPLSIGSVSRDVISLGMGEYKNGTLQLMQAEFQVISPMVPVRSTKFLRFSNQLADDTWVVVDVSVVDYIRDVIAGNTSVNCRRYPSGCIVRDLMNGDSEVTWVEHMEYDENAVHHLYRPLLKSGIAFGAQKWVFDLQRQCELFPFIMSMPACGDNPVGKKSIAELAQRMVRNFCNGVCATNYKWEMLQISEDTKLMSRQSTGNPGDPPGVILSATTTVRMPISPRSLFDFLQDEKLRVHWDVLAQDGPMRKLLHIPKNEDLGNYISLLRTSVLATEANPSNVLILQDTRYDASGSIIAYAAVENATMNTVLRGDDSTNIVIIPSGFAIVPDHLHSSVGPKNREAGPSQDVPVGSLLTAGFQILANEGTTTETKMDSVNTVKSLMNQTIQGIKTAFKEQTPHEVLVRY